MNKTFINTLWPDAYNRQSMARIMRPILVAVSDLVKGYLFQLPDGAPLTADYTVTLGDSFIPVDASSAAVTITLKPAGEAKGKRYTVKKVDSSTNAVTVDGDGSETIDDSTTAAITTQYESICLMSDGTEWWIV